MEHVCAEERRALLATLLSWRLADPSWSQLGSQLLGAASEAEKTTMVADAFADRATGTLRVRISSLKQYEKWRGLVVPFDEASCYS
eukprot:5418463-Amphidinium_carterae.1